MFIVHIRSCRLVQIARARYPDLLPDEDAVQRWGARGGCTSVYWWPGTVCCTHAPHVGCRLTQRVLIYNVSTSRELVETYVSLGMPRPRLVASPAPHGMPHAYAGCRGSKKSSLPMACAWSLSTRYAEEESGSAASRPKPSLANMAGRMQVASVMRKDFDGRASGRERSELLVLEATLLKYIGEEFGIPVCIHSTLAVATVHSSCSFLPVIYQSCDAVQVIVTNHITTKFGAAGHGMYWNLHVPLLAFCSLHHLTRTRACSAAMTRSHSRQERRIASRRRLWATHGPTASTRA
jgi:hypothetical protein